MALLGGGLDLGTWALLGLLEQSRWCPHTQPGPQDNTRHALNHPRPRKAQVWGPRPW